MISYYCRHSGVDALPRRVYRLVFFSNGAGVRPRGGALVLWRRRVYQHISLILVGVSESGGAFLGISFLIGWHWRFAEAYSWASLV